MTDRTNPILSDSPARNEGTNPPSVRARLVWLQLVLPAAIILGVLAYVSAFEFVFADRVTAWLSATVEFLFFGLFGALMIFFALQWLRRHLESEEERELQARTQERHLAAITANSADAIIFVDNDNRIQEWNRGAELLFGYTASEIVGQHFAALLPESLQEAGEVAYLKAELEERGYIRGYQTTRVTKDGRELIVELTRTAIRDESGQIIGSSAILRDITERERIQQQIRDLNRHLEAQVAERTRALSDANRQLRNRHEELEATNKKLKDLDELKSEFVSLASHELRAPLANISGVFQLLLDERDGLTSNQREIVQIASEQVDRLARLVKGILNVSRIEAGEMPFISQAFDMLDLIEHAVRQWSASDNTHTYVSPDTNNLPSVWADRDRAEEVLTNLLDNARKYSAEGTEIRVETQVDVNRLVIAVIDQGEGIAPEELEKVFDKFHRVERDDARKTYGHGLGLYIAQKLVEAMDGEMWAESEPGQGSHFYFSLPLAGHHETPMIGASVAVRPNGHFNTIRDSH